MSPRGDKLGTDGNGGSSDLRSKGTVNKGGRPHRDNGRPKRSFRSVPRAARKGTLHFVKSALQHHRVRVTTPSRFLTKI
jgi:hypothetical protein